MNPQGSYLGLKSSVWASHPHFRHPATGQRGQSSKPKSSLSQQMILTLLRRGDGGCWPWLPPLPGPKRIFEPPPLRQLFPLHCLKNWKGLNQKSGAPKCATHFLLLIGYQFLLTSPPWHSLTVFSPFSCQLYNRVYSWPVSLPPAHFPPVALPMAPFCSPCRQCSPCQQKCPHSSAWHMGPSRFCLICLCNNSPNHSPIHTPSTRPRKLPQVSRMLVPLPEIAFSYSPISQSTSSCSDLTSFMKLSLILRHGL